MCILDSKPVNITREKGFEKFSRQIFDAGQYFSKMVDVNVLLSHRTTVNAIHINLFYYLNCQYFILSKSKY